jgi:DNA-binding transcriptional ArsR family regulator
MYAQPELMTTAANDLASIGSDLQAAHMAATVPTVGLVPAAAEECSRDLATAVGISEPTVSLHLTQLRRAGIVESQRRGMNVYHRASRDSLVALCAVLDPNCCR